MFQPRYVKHSQLLIRHAEKLIRYRRDLLSDGTIAELRAQIEKVRAALKARDRQTAHQESERLDAILNSHIPPHRDAVWRENVEVILVAIVVAVGIRSYFIQRFSAGIELQGINQRRPGSNHRQDCVQGYGAGLCCLSQHAQVDSRLVQES